MSDPSVPCHAPYGPATVHAGDQTVVLNVGRGDDLRSFTVHVRLLCRGSEYFNDRLRDRDDDELANLPLGLPAEDASLFAVFISFLTTGQLRHPNLRATTAPKYFFRFLVELFTFAKTFEATTMRNAVLNEFFLRIYTQPGHLPVESIRDVYDNSSEGSSLRDMIITTILNIGTGALVEQHCDDVPNKFLMDLLRTADDERVVPFGCKQGWEVTAWLQAKKERVCGEYHLHDEDEVDGDEGIDYDGGDDYGEGREQKEDKYDDDGGEDDEFRGCSERTRRELGSIYAIRARYTRY